MTKRPKPIVLTVLDGWGCRAESKGNAIALARKPAYDALLKKFPNTLIHTSGPYVGLPEGQMGNSEVGHLNIGAGRIVHMDIARIDLLIANKQLQDVPLFQQAMERGRQRHLHLMGLLSDGGVHSHINHLFALLEMAREQRLKPDQVVLHAILDGRDTPPRSGAAYLEQLEAELCRVGVGQIGTVIGRYYSMDRDNRWERTERAYAAYVRGAGPRAPSAQDAVQSSYADGQGDEFVEPTVIVGADGQPVGTVQDGDAIVFFNFRPDRARQITRAFTRTAPGGIGQPPVDVHFVCMTEYDATLRAPVAFPPQLVENPLGEIIAQAGLRQLRIAETEKYAHVTYFFNGGREVDFANEDRALIPSPKVATYDLQPEMSAQGITDELLRRLSAAELPYDLVVLNFANADMVGHTGVLEATITALQVVDACIGRIVERVRQLGGTVLITADHGNAEQMIDTDGGPLTAHTLNPVHLLLVDDRLRDAKLRDGIFADVAPTILGLLGLAAPAEMTGRDLLRD